MSRIGKAPIKLPPQVTVTIKENEVKVKGAKGELSRKVHQDMKIKVADGAVIVERPTDSKEHRSLHGLTRTLINNMVVGVTTGFEKELHLIGVGYKVLKQGNGIQILCGYSHPVDIAPIKGIDFDVEVEKGVNKIKVKGIDKELVGQVAANIRFVKPPEPYKGKGIKYAKEVIIRKLGKAGKTGK
ncbi:MAG: 50S ribosomal protein L6 [Candidatus Eremiobacteraeota bacterium]|nr:50S ribosomal protein L6 [Candidatus Eremiobacteraeota bacterium]